MSAPVMARVAHAVAAIRDGLHVSNTVMKKLLQDVHDAAEAQPPAEAHCTTCSCVPGMTPAVRFDTSPAEREGTVRDHLIRMGWTPPAEAQAQGGEFDYTDIANRAQEVTGRSVWPSTVKAVLEAAGSPAPDSCARPTDVP